MPSRPRPTGTLRAIRSKYSAWLRCSPEARCAAAPGRGGTYNSGSTRVVVISAASCTSAGNTPSSMRNTSEVNCAPSCRARTFVTTPAVVTEPTPGTVRAVITMSSSCRYSSGFRATQNSSGVESSTPSTRPTGRAVVDVAAASAAWIGIPPGACSAVVDGRAPSSIVTLRHLHTSPGNVGARESAHRRHSLHEPDLLGEGNEQIAEVLYVQRACLPPVTRAGVLLARSGQRNDPPGAGDTPLVPRSRVAGRRSLLVGLLFGVVGEGRRVGVPLSTRS